MKIKVMRLKNEWLLVRDNKNPRISGVQFFWVWHLSLYFALLPSSGGAEAVREGEQDQGGNGKKGCLGFLRYFDCFTWFFKVFLISGVFWFCKVF